MENMKVIDSISGIVMLNRVIRELDLSKLNSEELTKLHKVAAEINSTHNCDGALMIIKTEIDSRKTNKGKFKLFVEIILGVSTIIGAIIGIINLF